MIKKISYKTREEWEAIRNKYIGGSDAGAAAGMNPYKGPYALWMDKTGRGKPFEGNLSTETGTLLEGFVAELFTRETGKKVRKDNHTIVNDKYPWACANVDRRVVGENAILECKTTTSVPNVRKFRNGEYPDQWYCQVMHYMAVTECERAYIAALINNRELKIITVERDEDEIAALMRIESELWQHVQDDTEPEAGAYDGDVIKDEYPASDVLDEAIDFTPDEDLLAEYAVAEADCKLAEERRDALKLRICERMGQFTEAKCPGYKVTWKPQGSSKFDTKKFKDAHPEMDFTGFYKTSVSRVFRFAKTAK